jgi:hypothetical protein
MMLKDKVAVIYGFSPSVNVRIVRAVEEVDTAMRAVRKYEVAYSTP